VSEDERAADRGDLKSTTYELFILAVSVLSVVNLVLQFVLPWGSQAWTLIVYVDTSLILIFLIDFGIRVRSASSKRAYLLHGGGILDLLSCLPLLRVFRLFRIVRAIRIVRALGGPRVFGELRSEFASGALYLVVFLLVFTLEVVGLLELHFEEDAPDGNITTAGDALWWGYVTATTVGYGDKYPITPGGRISGLIMLTVGVGLFATFSGFLANTFLSGKRESAAPKVDDDVHATIAEVTRLQAEQQRARERLRQQMSALEPTSTRR
jgi:voltage-gated potassium channel